MSIGADVPSQLEPGLALVTGAGEHVQQIDSPARLAFVLLVGIGRLSTAGVYARADEFGLARAGLNSQVAELREAIDANAATAGRGGAAGLVPLMHNDLQRAAVSLEPAITGALALLHEAGALAALVSGSGPAAFGIFRSGVEAEGARRSIVERWPGETVLAASVDASYAAPSPLDTDSRDRSGIGQ
jgi:4-diphosphocytidyl-2-C-methyl-D-erythritol kinase